MQSGVMKILQDNGLCVLCTCKDDIPDASLMQYICNYRCTKIYMLTLKESTKYLNIINNTNASLLIDTRDGINDKTVSIQAVTIYGKASIVGNKATSKKLINQLLKKHANLVNLALDINVCVVEISITSILFLESVDKCLYFSLPGN